MYCFHPVKLRLSEESQAKRQACEYMPLEWRYATEIYVPCGKCEACLQKRKNEWIFRLTKEFESSLSAYFVTLTYDDDKLPKKSIIIDDSVEEIQCVSKRDCQLFLKRLRKLIEPFKIRYYLVSEYGPKTLRPHYHMLLFNFPRELSNKIIDYVERAWDNGFITIDNVNPARIAYVCSYCMDNSTLPSQFVRNFVLCSRRPGIGHTYIDNDNIVRYHTDNTIGYVTALCNGQAYKAPMPRYYRSKLFDDEQSNQISYSNSKLHDAERAKLDNKQRKWLRKNKIGCTPVTINTAYPGSPKEMAVQAQEEFARKVRNKCKLKGNM